jgi:WD40 repeat protein
VFSLSDFGLVRTIGFHKKRFVCCLSGREQVLASADDQHHVAVHNAESGDCLFALPPFDLAVTALAFVPGENWLAVATLSDQIFVVDFVKKQHTPWSTMVSWTQKNVVILLVIRKKGGRQDGYIGGRTRKNVCVGICVWRQDDVVGKLVRSFFFFFLNIFVCLSWYFLFQGM